MPPEKTTWRKFTNWLSPLLLVSLGLHGLAMLIPLPGKNEPVEEPKAELPEPIAVTQLPKTSQPFSKLPPATSIPQPASGTVNPAPKPSSAVVNVPQPAPEPKRTPTQPSTPTITQPSTQAPTQPSTQAPTQPTQPSTQPTATPQPYSRTGTTNNEKLIAGGLFSSKYGKPEEVKPLLDLGYPANGKCFDQGTDLDAAVGISVDGQGNIAASELLQPTIYPAVNDWILAYLDPENPKPLPDDVFSDLQQTNPAAPPNGQITDWVNAARSSTTPFVPKGASQAPYAFLISITIEDNACP